MPNAIICEGLLASNCPARPRYSANLFVPFADGRYFVYWDDLKKTCREIAKFSRKGAEAYLMT